MTKKTDMLKQIAEQEGYTILDEENWENLDSSPIDYDDFRMDLKEAKEMGDMCYIGVFKNEDGKYDYALDYLQRNHKTTL